MTRALCPGSFDPPTKGHFDVIERALSRFDEVIVAVVANPAKQPMFSVDERMNLLAEEFEGRATIDSFQGLLVDYADRNAVDLIVKGLRAVSDFDYELQMAQMNRHLTGIETVFMPTSPEWSFLSSSLVREVAKLGGDYHELVPPAVARALEEKLK